MSEKQNSQRGGWLSGHFIMPFRETGRALRKRQVGLPLANLKAINRDKPNYLDDDEKR
jgi:hypothetical protein